MSNYLGVKVEFDSDGDDAVGNELFREFCLSFSEVNPDLPSTLRLMPL